MTNNIVIADGSQLPDSVPRNRHVSIDFHSHVSWRDALTEIAVVDEAPCECKVTARGYLQQGARVKLDVLQTGPFCYHLDDTAAGCGKCAADDRRGIEFHRGAV